MLQFGASLTDDTSSVNYDHNMFIIQATGVDFIKLFSLSAIPHQYKLVCSSLANIVRLVLYKRD